MAQPAPPAIAKLGAKAETRYREQHRQQQDALRVDARRQWRRAEDLAAKHGLASPALERVRRVLAGEELAPP
jgi:hypothetical protein